MVSHTGDPSDGTPLPANRQALLADYISAAQVRLGEATVIDYTSCIRVFLRWLDQVDPTKVGDVELRGFLVSLKQERKVNDRTVLRYYSALQSFFQYLEYFDHIAKSPVPKFRKRYLPAITREAKKNRVSQRPVLTVEEATQLVHAILDPRDRAVLVVLLKTGIRRGELESIDLDDIDWDELSIELKPKRKRTNPLVFFDDETARVLRSWLSVRKARGGGDSGPLFINQLGTRLDGRRIYEVIRHHAEKLGLYTPGGKVKEKFSPHATRHFYTTHLMNSGVPREWVAFLRGDAPAATIDLYNQIPKNAVREMYLAKIPQFDL